MRVILVRHGETDSNVNHLLDTQYPGAPLNQTGHQQARDLVERLHDEPIEALYASTLRRAQETARPLAAARGIEMQVLDGLREISAGTWELSPNWQHYVEVLRSWSPTNLDVGLEGGETARQFLARYFGALAQIEAAGHRVAAAVTHGAAMRVFALTVQPSLTMAAAGELRNTECIVLEGSSKEGWRVVRWGDMVVDPD